MEEDAKGRNGNPNTKGKNKTTPVQFLKPTKALLLQNHQRYSIVFPLIKVIFASIAKRVAIMCSNYHIVFQSITYPQKTTEEKENISHILNPFSCTGEPDQTLATEHQG